MYDLRVLVRQLRQQLHQRMHTKARHKVQTLAHEMSEVIGEPEAHEATFTKWVE